MRRPSGFPALYPDLLRPCGYEEGGKACAPARLPGTVAVCVLGAVDPQPTASLARRCCIKGCPRRALRGGIPAASSDRRGLGARAVK